MIAISRTFVGDRSRKARIPPDAVAAYEVWQQSQTLSSSRRSAAIPPFGAIRVVTSIVEAPPTGGAAYPRPSSQITPVESAPAA
jgi:hypothetical protein